MWLDKRLKELNMTYDEFGQAVGISGNTIKLWIHRNRVPRYPDEIEDWELIANTLKWSKVELLTAIGWHPDTDYPPELLAILERLMTLTPPAA